MSATSRGERLQYLANRLTDIDYNLCLYLRESEEELKGREAHDLLHALDHLSVSIEEARSQVGLFYNRAIKDR